MSLSKKRSLAATQQETLATDSGVSEVSASTTLEPATAHQVLAPAAVESGSQKKRAVSASIPTEEEKTQMRNFAEQLDYYNQCYFRFNRDFQELADQQSVTCVLPKKTAKYGRWQIIVARVAAQKLLVDKGIAETAQLQFQEFENENKTRQFAVIEFVFNKQWKL